MPYLIDSEHDVLYFMNCYLHCQSASVSIKLQIHLDVKIVISDHYCAASSDKLDIR